MKKYCILLIVVLLLTPLEHAWAHVLKADGSVGAVLHIDPQDDPVAGEPANFFFEIKDKDSKFTQAACECIVHIIRRGNTIYTNVLGTGGGLESPVFTYTFPERDIYTIKLTGQPKTEGVFQPFTLSYDLRVDKESHAEHTQKANEHLLHYILFGGAFVVVLALFIRERLSKKSNKHDHE